MIKQIIISILLIFSIFFGTQIIYACKYTEWGDLWSMLNGCKPKTLVWWSNDLTLDSSSQQSWLKTLILKWITNITVIILILAVASLVYAWLLFQLRNWEDEKVNKAKNLVKWVLIWTLLMVSASWIIALIITVIYWLAWWK